MPLPSPRGRYGPACFVAPPQHISEDMQSSARLAFGPVSTAGLGPGISSQPLRGCEDMPLPSPRGRYGPACFVAPPQHISEDMQSSARLAFGPVSTAGLGPGISSQPLTLADG